MPFTDFIIQLEEIPLTGDDLIIMSTKLGNSECKWIGYDELKNVRNIEELFRSGNNTIYILLQISGRDGGNIGHWISLIKYNDPRISFDYAHYDSYGFSVDQELSITHESPLLFDLLKGLRIDENRVQHQAFKNKQFDVNTCGRHTVTRSVFYYMDNANYNKLIIQPILKDNNVKDPDVMVSILTGFLPPNDDPVRDFFMNKVGINSNVRRGTPF